MKFILTICLLFISFFSFSQIQKIDSLKNKIKFEKSKIEKAKLQYALGNEFLSSGMYIDSAFFYVKNAYTTIQTEDLPEEKINLLFSLAVIYNSVNQLDLSLDYYKQALEISKAEKIENRIPAIINNIGDIYMDKKEYENAMNYFEEALELSKLNHNKRLEAVSYLNMGEVNYYKSNLKKSKALFKKSEKIFDSIEIKPIETNFLIARTYFALHENEVAKKKSLEGYNNIKNKRNYYNLYKYVLLLSEIYTEEEDLKTANKYNKLALAYNDSIYRVKDLNEIEKLFIKMELQQQNKELQILEQKNKYINVIYIIAAIVIILLIFLISRQRKINKMTKNIHDIQTSLIKYELDLKNNKEKTALDATREGDRNFLRR